jgi:hypothetical protein
MKYYLADKPVKAAPLIRVERVPEMDGRAHLFVVFNENTLHCERAIHLDDGPMPDDCPNVGDFIIDHGTHLTWQSPEEFAENYLEVAE